METVQAKVQTKIFIGTQLRPDIKLLLDQSPQWKQVKISQETALRVQDFQGKQYLGLLAPEGSLSLCSIEALQTEVSEQLATYCPELDTDKLKYVVFPQTFVQ